MGPGTYAIDKCPVVREETPKKWTFSKSNRVTMPIHKKAESESYGYQSSVGKQVDSRHPNKNNGTIGKSTRDGSAKAGMYHSTMTA